MYNYTVYNKKIMFMTKNVWKQTPMFYINMFILCKNTYSTICPK